MTLAAPVAMSVVGDAEAVRHLRAGGASYAVWLINDDGYGHRFVVRQRTGTINIIATLRTDGADFSERIVPLPPTPVVSYHVIESSPGVVTFMFSDGLTLKSFTWDVTTNVVLTPPTVLASGSLPSQFTVDGVLRQFYVRDRDVKVKVAGGPEITIIDPTSTEARDQDVVRKSTTAFARYAGVQAINRDLALPFLSDSNVVFCYDGTSDLASVTELLPAGTVGYWTFDVADFSGTTLLDQSGNGLNGTLVGTAPASVTGQVNQARDFVGGSGNGHYSLGNPASLRITGDLSIAFWIRPDNFSQRVNPYAKSYGGEGTITLETDGSLAFYYGTGGIDTNPYSEYGSAERLLASQWSHAVLVRDVVNRYVRWFINGKMVSHDTAWVAAAVTSTQAATIGKGYTGFLVDGLMDELIVANQAFSPAQVAALYAKGLGGFKANISGSGSARRLLDSGPGARHAFTSAFDVGTATGRAQISGKNGTVLLGSSAYATSAALTIEATVMAKLGATAERNVFSNYVGPNSSGTRIQGTVRFSYQATGMLRFKFETSTATVEYQQTGGELMRFNAVNHITVSHTFGSGGNTFMSVNGVPVPARWVGGGGSESPTLLAAAPSTSLNPGDELRGLRVSSVAKTITQIRDYMRGRS